MSVASININVDSEIKDRAQEVFTSLGLDMSTAVNIFLKQAIRQHGIPFAVTAETIQSKPIHKMPQLSGCEGKIKMAEDFDATLSDGSFEPDPTKVPQPGCLRGKIWMAEDFDAPMEEFEEYM